MSSRRTPRKVLPDSPLHTTRLEEKEQLQDLNQRLEFYILKQRERDAAQAALEGQIEDLKARHADDLKEKDNENDILKDDIKALQDENAGLSARVEPLENDLNDANENIKRLTNRVNQVETENKNLKKDRSDAQRRADQLQIDLTDAIRRINDLQGQLKDAQEENAELKSENAQQKRRIQHLDDEVRRLQEELARLKESSARKIEELRDQIEKLQNEMANIENEIRSEFTQQLAEELDKRQAAWEAEKNNALDALRRIYEEKLEAYRDHLGRAGHELEEMKQQRDDAVKEAEEARSQVDFLNNQIQALQKRIQDLENLLKERDNRPNRTIQELNTTIEDMKRRLREKDNEFDRLMSVKVALEDEIKTYQKLLEGEETRLNYDSPRKKRKRTNDYDGVEVEEEVEIEADVGFSGNDAHGKYVTLQNLTSHEIKLDGWSLQSQKKLLKFDLSNALGAGEKLTIWFGAGARDHENLPSDIACEDLSWHEDGDEALLVDARNVVADQITIEPAETE